MHRASFRLDCGTPAQARLLADAVGPELEEGPEGTAAQATLDKSTLVLELTGDDLSGLRAAMHGALRLLDTAQRIAESGGKN